MIVPVPEPLLPEVWVQLNDCRPRVQVHLVGLGDELPSPTVVVALPDFAPGDRHLTHSDMGI